MRIAPSTAGIHHIALRSTDLARSRRFYADVLGLPIVLDAPAIFLFLAGRTAIAVRGPDAQTPPNDAFNPFRPGLDHLALGCADESELQRVASALATANVDNTGVKVDPTLNRRYVAFKDPDRIAWEFYMAPNPSVAVVSAYFDGMQCKNVDAIPFAPLVRFEGPLGPAIRGADSVRQFLRGMLPLVTGVRVHQMLNDGDHVAVRFDLETVYGSLIGVFDWFHVVDGAITEVRTYYDPRPLMGTNLSTRQITPGLDVTAGA